MTQKEIIMKNLGVDAATADEILAADKAIDRGERVEFDLTPEQEKATRKYRQSDRKVSEKKVVRERKENPIKRQIIADVAEFLCECGILQVEITNVERQIAFSVGDENFELTLVQKRKSKKQYEKTRFSFVLD